MPTRYKYAMKLGEVYLESNEPITPDEVKEAKERLRRAGYKFRVGTDLDAVLRTD